MRVAARRQDQRILDDIGAGPGVLSLPLAKSVAPGKVYAVEIEQGFLDHIADKARQAGVTNYEEFARKVLDAIPDRPISFEVFSDEFKDMQVQALKIASWGSNVYVKIPVTNTLGESSEAVIRTLARAEVKLNVTALLALDQVRVVGAALGGGPPACVSVFAGRVADTGRDPVPLMAAAVELLRPYPNIELI